MSGRAFGRLQAQGPPGADSEPDTPESCTPVGRSGASTSSDKQTAAVSKFYATEYATGSGSGIGSQSRRLRLHGGLPGRAPLLHAKILGIGEAPPKCGGY